MDHHISPNYQKNSIVYPHLSYSTILGITNRPKFYVDWRTIDDYILLYIKKGVFFCEQNDTKYTVIEGQYILIDLHKKHRYYFDANIPSEIYWMHMNGEQTAKLVQIINSVSPLPIIGTDIKIFEYLELSIYLHEHTFDAFQYAAHINNTLSYILSCVYQEKHRRLHSKKETEFQHNFEQTLLHIPPANWSLDTICQHMHISKYYFAHQFKKYFSLSPMQYLRNKKLEKSQKLLTYTSLNIAQIAEECGFSSADYFSTAFHHAYSISPKEYRKTSYKKE